MSHTFSVNGVSLTQYGKAIQVMIEKPGREVSVKSIPKKDGVVIEGMRDTERYIIVTIIATGTNADSKVSKIVQASSIRKVVRLETSKDPTKYYKGTLAEKPNVEDLAPNVRKVTLKFMCNDPRAFGREKKKFTMKK